MTLGKLPMRDLNGGIMDDDADADNCHFTANTLI